MEFNLDEAMAALTRTPAALKAMLSCLPRNWVENNEGPETWVTHDLDHVAQVARTMAKQYTTEVGPWQAYVSILHDRTK